MSSQYLGRILPALSIVALIALTYLSLTPRSQGAFNYRHLSIWQTILGSYALFVHALSVNFPIRGLCALRNVIQQMKKSAADLDTRTIVLHKIRRHKMNAGVDNDLRFVIIIPAYKEDVNTLSGTLRVLASHPQAKKTYHIYLAMEEREENAQAKASSLKFVWSHAFSNIDFTLHPSGIPGEAPGKSSNESWAAAQVSKDYSKRPERDNIVITTIDADTYLSSRYFDNIQQCRYTSPETFEDTMFMPPLVFDRNLYQMSLLVRLADIMWAGAGLSNFYRGSKVCIPTSVYSLPLTLVDKVGGWDTNWAAIGEDMHMYLKCYFTLRGKLNVQVIYAAASQSNIGVDMSGPSGYIRCLQARYSQALRHMWGALDSGYAIRESCRIVWEGYVPSYSFKSGELVLAPERSTTNVKDLPTVFHRLFEAHFLPAHLFIIVTAFSAFATSAVQEQLPYAFRITIVICSICRFVSFVLMLGFLFEYERYHKLCVSLRKEEMRSAGLLEGMSITKDFTESVFGIGGLLETILFPLAGLIYGIIPVMQAVVSHIFTEELVYVVSLKPATVQWKI